MRTADKEYLEMLLEPLRTAKDRHESEIHSINRAMEDVRTKVKDLKRDAGAHSTAIEQGLASIRSLLQRANRAARAQGIIEDDEPDLTSVPPDSTVVSSPAPRRTATGRGII